ncbi:MAG: hypothetical protein K0Q70_1093 [Rhodospirillales bacterium]|nr:hypothetical protein [Rhodospirillales bacterium]
MAVVIPQFDPRVTVVNTLSGGINSSDRALLNMQGTQQARAAASLQKQFGSRIDAALAQFQDAGNSPIVDSLLRQQSDLAGRKARINEAVTVVKQALSQFDYLKNHVTHLRDQLDQLENGDLTAAEVATEWDNKLRKINQLADAGAKILKDGKNYYPKNLIDTQSRSAFTTQTLYAPYNTQGETYAIGGVFLGTDYYITEDGSGDFWNSDTGYAITEDTVGTLSEYASYPGSPTGVNDAVDAITLDSFNRSSGAVTFTLSDASQISGTVTRGGLGLLDAFLYGNFDTGVDPNAIDNARADLNEAEALLLNTQAQYRSDLATLQSRVEVFDARIEGLSTDASNLVRNLRSDKEANLLSAQLEYLVARFDFALLAGRGNTLIKTLVLAQDNAMPTTFDTVATGEAIAGARVDVFA